MSHNLQKQCLRTLPSLEKVLPDLCPSGKCRKINQWVSLYGSGTFQAAALCWVLRMIEFLHKSFKSSISVSQSFSSSRSKPQWFSKPNITGTHLLSAAPQAGEPSVRLGNLAPREDPCGCNILLLLGSHIKGVGSDHNAVRLWREVRTEKSREGETARRERKRKRKEQAARETVEAPGK